jgi:hypothetical protein
VLKIRTEPANQVFSLFGREKCEGYLKKGSVLRLKKFEMDLVCVRIVFLVLIGISGCNTLTTVVSTTGENRLAN